MGILKSEQRELRRAKARRRMPTLADQVKRKPVRTRAPIIHVRKKA